MSVPPDIHGNIHPSLLLSPMSIPVTIREPTPIPHLARRRRSLSFSLQDFDLLLRALDGPKVLDRLDPQLHRRVPITAYQSPRVELDGGDCPEVVDTLFDAFGEGEGFSLAGDD